MASETVPSVQMMFLGAGLVMGIREWCGKEIVGTNPLTRRANKAAIFDSDIPVKSNRIFHRADSEFRKNSNRRPGSGFGVEYVLV